MSLVFGPEIPDDKPQTHALVIGVGDYPHLLGGKLCKPSNETFGLRRLDSPPLSAIEFANWLRKLTNKRAPVGTIDVLLSPGEFRDPAGGVSDVETASMGNIRRAFKRWSDRAGTNPDNIAIFYFCGHGFEKGVTILLPADFADPDEANIGINMIDLEKSWLCNLKECSARTQVYLIDACRETPVDLLKENFSPTALISSKKLQEPRRNAPILFAANSGTKAHAAAGQVSYFTRALLDCFSKLGAAGQNNGVWEITTDSLGAAMRYRMAAMKVEGLPPFSCDVFNKSSLGKATVLHTMAGPAYAVAEIDCAPSEALSLASFSIQDSNGSHFQRSPLAEVWSVEVPAGSYDIRASFGGRYKDALCSGQLVHPPVTPCTLDAIP